MLLKEHVHIKINLCADTVVSNNFIIDFVYIKHIILYLIKIDNRTPGDT